MKTTLPGRCLLHGAAWTTCAGCGRLFPAAPDQTRCADCTGRRWSR
ncbi:MAG TPA: hypothetical protein VFM55_04075 [Micromonosporaceae bacterium]|nr:hypothetical protein [Micromonosporaceae bacterium]